MASNSGNGAELGCGRLVVTTLIVSLMSKGRGKDETTGVRRGSPSVSSRDNTPSDSVT
jgi:hypothetical protein